MKLIIAVAVLCSPAYAGESKVKLADLPAAVQKTVKEQSQGAKLKRLLKDAQGKAVTYEAELTVNGHSKDVSIDPDGNITEVEEEVTLSAVPAPAKAALEKIAGTGKIVRVEAISHNGPVEVYEADIKSGKKTSEARVDPTGKEVPKP